jgi:hypothetical protein
MATKSDFTEQEWETMQRSVTGAGMLVSLSDRHFTDSFGEAKALAKYLSGQQAMSESTLVRDLAAVHGSGFGLTTAPAELETETLEAIRSSVATIDAKAPDEKHAYRQLVVGLAHAVADAKGGEKPNESAAIQLIEDALGPF